jgi:hypothetical protein
MTSSLRGLVACTALVLLGLAWVAGAGGGEGAR